MMRDKLMEMILDILAEISQHDRLQRRGVLEHLPRRFPVQSLGGQTVSCSRFGRARRRTILNKKDWAVNAMVGLR